MPRRGTTVAGLGSSPGRRWPAVLVGATLVLAGASIPGRAQSPAPAVPPAPADVVAAKAYGALERNCARCHQAGRLENRSPGAGLANILSLDEIARDPALVRPGLPDASRLYNVALTRELHHDLANDPPAIDPTPLEVQALRDWIGELPTDAISATADTCAGRQAVTPVQLSALVEESVASLTPERARQTRYLSLAHLHNACLPDRELDALRRGAAELLERLAPQATPAPPGGWAAPADPRRLLLTVALTELGWSAAAWTDLVARYPLRTNAAAAISPVVRAALSSDVAVVHADWFASAALNRTDAPPHREHGSRLWGLDPAHALAQAWRRPADLRRVLADLGLSTRLELVGLPGFSSARGQLAAQQIMAGAVARRDALDQLYAAVLAREPVVPEPAAPPAPTATRLDIALAPDKPSYKAGDIATFTVTASRDCFLTLVAVDRGGRATVLFPNELQPDNRIAAGAQVRVPGEGTPYRFRFKDRGRETIVAICSLTHKAPEGVHHDYDRLRFTVLGDWQLLLREPPDGKVLAEARRDDAATDIPRPSARPSVRQRQRGQAPKAETAPISTDVQTRTAIVIDIE